MSRGYVKWAIAQELDGEGDDQDAQAHLRRVDPLLRGIANRRFQSELLSYLQTDPEDSNGRSILLGMAKELAVSPTKGPVKAPFWWATTLLTALLSSVIGYLVYAQLTKPAPFSPDEMERVVERPDAYLQGGRPMSLGEEGKELFGKTLPGFVIALDRHSRKPSEKTKEALQLAEAVFLAPANKSLVGAEVYQAMIHLTEACHATLLDGEGVSGDVDELNAAFVKQGLSYYIDSDVLTHKLGASPLLYSHFVEKVRVFRIAPDAVESVYWLRRLDSINYKTNMLGSTHKGATAAVIRRDLINEEVHELLLPALAKDSDFSLWSPSYRESLPEIQDSLEALSGAKIRADFTTAGVSESDASELAGLLSKRDKLFGQLTTRAKASGYNVAIPTGYRFDMARYRRLEHIVGKPILRKLNDIDESLGSEDMAAVYKKVRSAFVTSVEFHELQHRLDYKRKERIPEVLSRALRPVEDGEALSSYSRRVVTEYSAYMAQIANSDLPFVVLVLLSKNAFNHKSRSSVYMQAAVAVIESLCSTVEIEHRDFVVNRTIDRLAIAEAFVQVLALSHEQLRAAAGKAWEEGFESKLVRPAIQ
ncbi:MAG: hypothetical protein JKY56_06530 [Kofleriaceae bacterium]|nr:hypothetical protein [Kofleriaceae bacterium]